MKHILMKRIKKHRVVLMGRWLFTIALSMLLITLPSGCTDDNTCNGNKTSNTGDTYIHLNVSTADVLSRASNSEENTSSKESTSSEENIINKESQTHSLRVWAFNSDTQQEDDYPLSYKEERNLSKNSQHSLSIKIPRQSGGKELKHIDLFILANAESGSTLGGEYNKKMITRKELQEAKFTQHFIIDENTGKPLTTSVPEAGLPISRIVTQISVEDGKTLNIPLLRGVFKMHFWFTKDEDGLAKDAEVTRIELDENHLTWGGYVFPDAAPYADLATKGLKASGTLEYIKAKAIPDSTIAYYNETDHPISGTIFYKKSKNSEERKVTFTYPAGTAIRNHELRVKGHFDATGELQLKYEIVPWTTKDVYVETKDLRFLNVYPQQLLMKNVDSNNEATFFASDACTVEIKDVYYYDKKNQKQTLSPGNSQYPTLTLEGTKSGKLKISSPIPTNKTVKYIQARIQLSGTSLYKDILIKQYPLEYAQNIVGLYSTRSTDGWVRKDKEGGTYQDYAFKNGRDTLYGYTAKIYKDGDIKYYKGGNSIGGSSYNSNNLMYVIQITSTNGKYVIAHPKLKADGTSDDHVVSPAFMIASQLGAVLAGGFDAESAIEHSKTYREVAADGTIYDNWRLPTKEEIAIIIEYQGKANSPIDNVLTGQYYRTLSKETVATGIKGANGGYFVRCIRDLTPEEVTKLEQNK